MRSFASNSSERLWARSRGTWMQKIPQCKAPSCNFRRWQRLQRNRNTKHGASYLFGNWLTTSPGTLLGRKVYRHHVQRRQANCCLHSNWICSQSPTNWKGLVGDNGEEIWQRPHKRSHNFGKSGQCAWRPGQLQPAEGPARACPENRGAALRERSSPCSHNFEKSGQCAWMPGQL